MRRTASRRDVAVAPRLLCSCCWQSMKDPCRCDRARASMARMGRAGVVSAAAAVATCAISCVETTSVECGDGRWCSEGRTCDPGTRTCVDPAACGNDRIDTADGEVCDGDRLGDTTCESLGLHGSRPRCNDDCRTFDVSACDGKCGD